MKENESSSISTGTAASPIAGVVVFIISLGLHRGMDWLRDLRGAVDLEFKLWGIGALAIAILVPLWAAVRLLRLNPRQALNVMRPNWRRTTVALVTGFIVAVAFNIVWPQIVAPSSEYLKEMGMFISYKGTTEFVLVLLLVVIAAPFADELLFRGFMLRSFSMRYGKTVAAIITALITALFHTWEPFKLVHAFVMGIIFATAVLWSRSVIVSIMLHALLNSLSLLPGVS